MLLFEHNLQSYNTQISKQREIFSYKDFFLRTTTNSW